MSSHGSAPVGDPPPFARSLIVLALPALMFSLSQTAVIPAIGDMARDLRTTPDAVAWTLTGNLVASAVLTPVLGRLGDMMGRRRMLVVSLCLFAVGSAVSALGPNIWIVVLGRLIQGGGGGIFPLSFGIARDTFGPARLPGAIGMISALTSIGGGVGLISGGALTDNLSFRWIFGVNCVLAVGMAVMAHRLLPPPPPRAPGRVDVPGAIVLGVGLSCALVAISRSSAWGWSDPRTPGLLVVGLLILVGWVQFERGLDDPLVHIPTLMKPTVAMSNLSTLLVGFAMFGSFILMPQLLQAPRGTGYGFGYSATQAGLVMAPGSLLSLGAGPLSGYLAVRLGAKVPMAAGSLMASVGLALVGLRHGSLAEVMSFSLISSFGLGLVFAAMPNLIVEAVPSEMTGQATGVNALVRTVGASVGGQVSAALLSAGTIAGGLYASNLAFTQAFVTSAVLAVCAGIVGALIPRRAAPDPQRVSDKGARQARMKA